MKLEMRNKDDCTFDMISLGEIMLRFENKNRAFIPSMGGRR